MVRLIVFSDDWGRHPSSCQHLVGKLLGRDGYQAVWVNTIGTRTPKLSLEDIGKAAVKLWQWVRPPKKVVRQGESSGPMPGGLTVVTPKMLPSFRGRLVRRLNAWLISRAVNKALGSRVAGEQRVVVTTIPVVADLVGRIDADRWLYYCVDDFSVWPGLDGGVMREMEQQLVGKVDGVVAVSETLRKHLSGLEAGRLGEVELLTHGIDMWHWSSAQSGRLVGPDPDMRGSAGGGLPGWWGGLTRPILLFWGLIDRRLDTEFCRGLSEWVREQGRGSVVLVGPEQSPDPQIRGLHAVVMPGAVGYEQLPRLAAEADVLIMPYSDLPVTRAMQPLKFKEYLATGQPVVVRDLPATREWSDSADVVVDVDQLVQMVATRAAGGIAEDQAVARERRLPSETWHCKAERFEELILGLFSDGPNEETTTNPGVGA